jgi:hypothetical protein
VLRFRHHHQRGRHRQAHRCVRSRLTRPA